MNNGRKIGSNPRRLTKGSEKKADEEVTIRKGPSRKNCTNLPQVNK